MHLNDLRSIAEEGSCTSQEITYAIKTWAGSPAEAFGRDKSIVPFVAWCQRFWDETRTRLHGTMPTLPIFTIEHLNSDWPEVFQAGLAVRIGSTLMRGDILSQAQMVSAEKVWLNYDIGNYESEGQDDWEYMSPSNNIMQRKVYMSARNDKVNSTAILSIVFKPGTMEVVLASMSLNGESIGKRHDQRE